MVADEIGVRARANPISEDDGFMRSGGADDNVRFSAGGLNIAGDGEGHVRKLRGHFGHDGFGFGDGPAPNEDAFQRTYAEIGADDVGGEVASA